MGYMADMSTTDNLLKVHELLPEHIQFKWAKVVYKLMENQMRPNFSHITGFVEEQAKVAGNVNGKRVGRSQKPPKSTLMPRKSKETRATFATQDDTYETTYRKTC
ncbi:hypothetical protein HOLleu_28621 [Holothuria leucospilota]|uniref:Uncharacterized protein n=1 Tax=Holothuria leucospilota TaxID=206669 RepID=A0A9Q1BM84_HOLLE|nr:hypothetical protein HOLleu_28621 [Holothuria leucospilota]